MFFNTKVMDIKRGEKFRLLGRPYYIDDVPNFTWSNSGIEFTARFDRLTVFFGTNPIEQPVLFKIFVDNREYKTSVAGSQVTAVIENLREKVYTVKILRISEGANKVPVEKVQIYGKNPDFFDAPKEKKLKLEFVGDSITAGFGVLADGAKMDYTTYEQDSTKTYAYLTAKALDADIRTICISGQGICHSCGDFVGTTFVNFFNKTSHGADDCIDDDYVPDVFIINGGTNDKRVHVSSDEFRLGVKNLLSAVRAKYPKTPIVWMYGMMMHVFDEELKDAIAEFNETDKNTFVLIVKAANEYKNQIGTCGHPNVNASVRCSKILVRKIRELLGL